MFLNQGPSGHCGSPEYSKGATGENCINEGRGGREVVLLKAKKPTQKQSWKRARARKKRRAVVFYLSGE